MCGTGPYLFRVLGGKHAGDANPMAFKIATDFAANGIGSLFALCPPVNSGTGQQAPVRRYEV